MEAKSYIQTFRRLKTVRANWESLWEEVADYVAPNMRDSFTTRSEATQGQKKTQKAVTSQPIIAASRCTAVFDSLLTPHSTRWHGLRPTDPTLQSDIPTRDYFDQTTDALFFQRYAPKADFIANMQAVWYSMVVFGTGVLFVDKHPKGGLRYKAMHLGDIYLSCDHTGAVNSVYRAFTLTADQAVGKFPEGLPEEITKLAGTPQGDRKFEFLHCVQPREMYDTDKVDGKNKPYESVYISMTKEVVISEGGFDTFPYMVARYAVAPGEDYGRGPAIDLLPSIKALNQMARSRIKVCNRLGDPTWLAHDDGVIDPQSLVPGKIAFGGLDAQGRKLVQALDIPAGQAPHIDEAINTEMAQINDAFLVSLFQILTETPTMTATEVMERVREKAILLSPVMGSKQNSVLGALIERELDILSGQRMLPPSPTAEKEIEYEPEFNSPLNKQERAGEAAGVLRTLESLLAVANATQDTSVLDVFDRIRTARFLAEANSVPARLLATDTELANKAVQRQQAADAQMAIQAAPAVSAVVKGMGGLPV